MSEKSTPPKECFLSETHPSLPSSIKRSRSSKSQNITMDSVTINSDSSERTPNAKTINNKSTTPRGIAQFTTLDAFGLSPKMETTTQHLTQNEQKKSNSHSRATSTNSSVDSAVRRLQAIRMKINMANAIVQNAVQNAKVPMTQEERKREMLQLEAAKVIIFVGRQFNVREELQNVLGQAYDERESFGQFRNSSMSEAPFAPKEAPPDLSMKELRRITAEMESVLEQEKVKRGKTGKEPQLTANKVNSNLSELLWIIESLELEMPASQYADIEEEIGSPSLTTSRCTSPMSELLKQRQEYKEQQQLQKQQQEQQQQQQQQIQQQSLSQTKLVTHVPQMGKPLSPLASDMARMSVVVNSSHSSVGESQTSSDKEDKLIAFSVDNESVGCTIPEVAELKLLQFMYDAVAQNEEISDMDVNKDKHSQQEVFEEQQRTQGNIPLDSEGNLPHSKRKRGHHKSSDSAKQISANQPFQMPWNEAGVLKSIVMDMDDEESKEKNDDEENEEEMQPIRSDITGGTSANRMSMSTMQSTVADHPSFASWMRPTLPTMRVLPMRSDLIEILQKLYENFNYNHHFRQCRPEKESVRGKSQAEYAEEMMKRLAQQKNERRLKSEKKDDEDENVLSSWRGKSPSLTENELLRKRSSMNKRVSILDEPESSPPLPDKELATPAQVEEPSISRPSSSPPEVYDETILLSVEVGDGLLFVIKGRKDKSPESQTKRKKRNNSSAGEGQKKKIGKGRNSIANSSGRNSLAGDKGKNEKEKGRPGSVSTLSAEADTTKPEPEFDTYTLYAMNQSNKPVSGLVNIDMKKFQNLKLKALLDYTVTKKTISVKLPPHNSQAVLTLHPIKKGKEVLFKDALNFEEEKEEEKTPSEVERASKLNDKGKLSKTRSTGKFSLNSTVSNLTSTGTLQSTSRSEGEKVSKETKEIKPSIPATIEKDNEKTDTSAAVVVDSHGDESKKSDDQVGKVPIGKDTQHKLSEPENNLGDIKKIKTKEEEKKEKEKEENDAENDYSSDVTITKKKSNYRKSSPNLRFPGSIGSELNWGNVLSEGSHVGGGFDDDLNSENADMKGVMDSWNTNELQEPKEGEKEMKQKSRQDSKNIIPSRGEKDNVDVDKHGRLSEIKGTGKTYPVRGTSANSPPLTPVSEWGKPLKDPKEEALERDRIVQSVLHSSAFSSDPTNAAKIAAGRTSEDEKMDAIIDEALNDSASSSPSQRYPSGRLDSNYRSAEQVVATFLQHIAEEEQLGPVYTQDSDQNEDIDDVISPKAYSSTQRHQVPTSEGDIGDLPAMELNQQEKGEEGQQASRLTSAGENRIGSGGKKQNQLEVTLTSPYLGDIEGKESAADFSSSSTKHHSTSTTGVRLSNEEARTRRSHRQTVDGHIYSADNSGASGTPGVFCETCSASLRHVSDSFPTKGSDSITGAARHSSRVTSAGYRKGTKGSTSVITDIEGDKSTNMSTRVQDERTSIPTQPLLPYDTSLEKLQAQGQDKLQRDSMLSVASKEENEYDFFKEEELMSPGRMRVYTETRPGGRVAILVPEKMDTVPVPPSAVVPGAKTVNKMTASETKKSSLSPVEMFAQGIRSSLHTNARQVIAHGSSSNIPNHEGSFRRMSERGSKKKSVDGIRYAALPPLSVLYAADTVQEVDDVEAAEEEARNLFMRDPARYDCVVDDLVSRALTRVMEEEEKERAAEAQDALFIQRIVGTAADGLHTASSPNAMTITTPLGSRPASAHLRLELDGHLEQQRRARRIIAYILLEMRRMWRRRELEANVALRAAVERQIRRVRRLAWRVERRRVLGLRAVLNRLDRATGRRRGWIPPLPAAANHRNYGCNYNHRKKEAAGDGVMMMMMEKGGNEEMNVWGPVRPPMSLARPQRVLPIQVVRQHPVCSTSPQQQIMQQELQQQQQQHVLFGYKRTLLEPYMTTAVRMRHERRTRYAAPFQRPTKRFSPQEEWMDGTPKI